MQDNQKLPEILAGIEGMFGQNSPAALVVKTILLHLSIDMREWPPPNHLTEEEIRRFIDRDLLPLLTIMHLVDSDGWSLFGPDPERLKTDTLEAFAEIGRLLTSQGYGDQMDKDFWVSIAKSDYHVPEGYTLTDLTEILFSYLGSTDPELRDDIAYTVYANWLKQEMYSREELESHVEKLLSNLDQGIGETGSDTVFLRTFSILLLAEIVHNDNKKQVLETDQVRKILEKGLWYLEAEQDPRGHVPVKGWAHALAHTADLLLVLARNRNIDGADLSRMLSAIHMKIVHSGNYVYIHGEDERLAHAVLEILRRDQIPLEAVESWIITFTTPDGRDWKGAFVDEERNRAFQNTRNLLRSIYLSLASQSRDFPNREPLMVRGLASLEALRPF